MTMALRFWIAAGLATMAAAASAQVVLGQTDTFDADVMDWQGAEPTWISGGGPGGAGDAFLQLHSTGQGGPGGKMAGFNSLQWAGDFIGAGVGAIDVDFANLGDTDLDMRLVFFDATLDTQWESLTVYSLAAGSDWTHATFALQESDFVQVSGTTSFADTLGNVNRMMFRHNPTPDDGGVKILATMGIDNIHGGAPVPEPASLAAVGLGLGFLLRRRKG